MQSITARERLGEKCADEDAGLSASGETDPQLTLLFRESSSTDASMLHPLLIFMVVINVFMSIIFWTFLMAEVFFKEAETEEARAEAAMSAA
ncbi:hypothetical protein G5714_002497 [Onychostoma macrolepis]|uniref:Uncharacterized protein n=1 Tax=Onychostoma macrolepis TaxID=369639 RepID=A0A7J6DGM9_9TELE|nr:hypothetical protein G5714_002497 [Onychostoma macrolepis]